MSNTVGNLSGGNFFPNAFNSLIKLKQLNFVGLTPEKLNKFPADLVTFTNEIPDGKFHFFVQCSSFQANAMSIYFSY